MKLVQSWSWSWSCGPEGIDPQGGGTVRSSSEDLNSLRRVHSILIHLRTTEEEVTEICLLMRRTDLEIWTRSESLMVSPRCRPGEGSGTVQALS